MFYKPETERAEVDIKLKKHISTFRKYFGCFS